MPLFYQQNINGGAKIGVWHIAEPESFFLEKVPLPAAISHWHKRLQHLAGRYLLQELFPDFPYQLIEIAGTLKPFLPNEEYHFSISHSGNYAAVIISKYKRVGIDIELLTAKADKIKHKFLNDDELKMIASYQLPATGNKYFNLLTLLWSCKEAVFKWYGNGSVDFKKHINITRADINLSAGSMSCEFLKQELISLNTGYVFFDDICLASLIQ